MSDLVVLIKNIKKEMKLEKKLLSIFKIERGNTSGTEI
jgi:hypothetical protein